MISIRNLNVKLGNIDVLKNIFLNLNFKGLVSILGPNGAGKTTLLKSILKLLKFSGEIRIKGIDIRKLREKELARIESYVPQEFNPNVDITVEEFLSLARYPYKSFFEINFRDNYFSNYIREFSIEGFLKRKIYQLSSGERQRILIVKAIIQDSDIILLDEPTSNLDLKNKLFVMNFLKEISKKKLIIYTTHEINIASIYSDYVILMKDGRIYKHGKPEDVINRENIRNVYEIECNIISHPKYKRPIVIF